MSRSPDELARLGLVAASLMHDLQALLGSMEEHASVVVTKMEAGQAPLAIARETVAHGREIRAMVQDVLATLSSGAAPPPPFDPVRILHREVERASSVLPRVLIHCRATLPEGVVVEGRRTLFERSVRNLLRNALRHSRERIEVRAMPDPAEERDGFSVIVEDDGNGVPETIRAHLFTPGVHGGHGGYGVGLASVAWAVDHLGGWVRLEEPELLGGARFRLWIPSIVQAVAPPPEGVDRILAGRTVVVVDDEESVRRAVVRLLARAGAHVVVVDVGPEGVDAALAEIEASAPDAILLDLHLGALSGEAVWERLRERSPETARRVAFFSGAIGWGEEGSEEIRGQPTIAKGLDLREFVLRVDRVIRLHGEAGKAPPP